MPFPRAIARFNRYVTNPIARTVAGWLPGFAVVHHRGRVTGREYHTPINLFRRPGGYAVALTYGPGSEWVQNVLAAGGCTLETRGRRVQLTRPRIVRDATRQNVPPPVRVILRLLDVGYFLELDVRQPGVEG